MTKVRTSKIDWDAVGRRLEALRIHLGVTKDALSRRIGIDPSSFTKIAKGEKVMKPEIAFALADATGTSMEFIYRGDLTRMDDSTRASLIAILNDLEK